MAGNSFGKVFTVTTFGESHGPAMGVVLDGCPPGIKVNEEMIQAELDKRKPGTNALMSQRKEEDKAEILSGVFEGKTLGTPIAILIRNKDAKSKDYSHLKDVYRPSHADFSWQQKYGLRDHRGGGRASARETVARVAAGAIAKAFLNQFEIKVQAYVSAIGSLKMKQLVIQPKGDVIENSEVRCPDRNISAKMVELIRQTKKQGDTLGGQITCVISNCPAGLGEPVFDKLQARLAHAMLSINAVKGFEYGSGFGSIEKKGTEINDLFEANSGQITTQTNYSGGIQGGISNGMPIYFNVAFKPVATVMQDQETVDAAGNQQTLKGKGRHDVCVVPRAVPIVESMACLVLADSMLQQKMLG
jgi:chorismate synthase